MKSDLGGFDLLTPVFHCGNQSCNCFWGVPDPFRLHTVLQSWKHDLYLTHVLFSSPFMSEQSLWWCLFGVDNFFWVLDPRGEEKGGGGDRFKKQHYFLLCFFSIWSFHAWSIRFNKYISNTSLLYPEHLKYLWNRNYVNENELPKTLSPQKE